MAKEEKATEEPAAVVHAPGKIVDAEGVRCHPCGTRRSRGNKVSPEGITCKGCKGLEGK